MIIKNYSLPEIFDSPFCLLITDCRIMNKLCLVSNMILIQIIANFNNKYKPESANSAYCINLSGKLRHSAQMRIIDSLRKLCYNHHRGEKNVCFTGASGICTAD